MISTLVIIALYVLGLIMMIALGNEIGVKRYSKLGQILIIVFWPGVMAFAIVWGFYDWLREKRYV